MRLEPRPQHGFTLIELLVVIGIVAILAGISFPVFSTIQERARVTQDMNNLRQLGLGTQMYLNDNDGVLFAPDATGPAWPGLLNPKYLSAWKVFQSPFDQNPYVENSATARVSYGISDKARNGTSGSLSFDRITNPLIFIIFAGAPDRANPLHFSGTAATPVLLTRPAGSGFAYGTHSNRQRIDVCMADWHVENMAWATFSDGASNTTAKQRWDPIVPSQ